MTEPAAEASRRRSPRVLLLTGPSGAGKSRLARRLHTEHGWPVVELDDFYRELGDPELPVSGLGLPDWDDVRSWHLDAATDALETLCRTGRVHIPVYDISASRVTGTRDVVLGDAHVVVAEGIFAAHTVAPLRERELLADAWCIRGRPWVTFCRRFVRDVCEHRKPTLTLWRRGQVLRRAEAGIVREQLTQGAAPMTGAAAEDRARHVLRAADRRGHDEPTT